MSSLQDRYNLHNIFEPSKALPFQVQGIRICKILFNETTARVRCIAILQLFNILKDFRKKCYKITFPLDGRLLLLTMKL